MGLLCDPLHSSPSGPATTVASNPLSETLHSNSTSSSSPKLLKPGIWITDLILDGDKKWWPNMKRKGEKEALKQLNQKIIGSILFLWYNLEGNKMKEKFNF